jgi:hypothetical protein
MSEAIVTGQLIALGASVAEFTGDFPQIDVPADINIAELEDDGSKPFFVTLPIIPHIGQVSGNGLLYDDALANSIAEQINAKRPGANFGHLAKDERATAFPHPKAFWVASKRVGDTLWAKAYVPVSEARQHLRNLMKVGGRIGTSIFGGGDFEEVTKGVKRLTNFVLETIDFAPPERAALGYGAPVMVTAEMADTPGLTKEREMSKEEVIQELRAVKVPPSKGWQAPKEPVQEQQAAAQEVTEMAAIREALGVPEGMNVVELVGELRDKVQYLTGAAIQSRISELVGEGVRLPSARGIITKLINAGAPRSVEEAETIYTQVVEMEEVKELLALTVREMAGPPAVVSGKVRDNARPKLDDTPENRKRAAAEMGLSI